MNSFLTTVSRYQVNLQHLAGKADLPSDFTTQNAPDRSKPNFQICNFVHEMEDSAVARLVSRSHPDQPGDRSNTIVPTFVEYTPTLIKAHARPRSSLTFGMLSAISVLSPLLATDILWLAETIVVPRSVLTALHIKLNHPSRPQFQMVLQRQFFDLDMNDAISRATTACHTCASQKSFPRSLVKKSSDDPPEVLGVSFAADVIKRYRQLILVL